jgi:uncharacterized Zn-binding protein involved in type VI secretion
MSEEVKIGTVYTEGHEGDPDHAWDVMGPEPETGKPANQHIADGEGAPFIVTNIVPDFCRVGKSVIPFDISRTLDHECRYVPNVYARGEKVLTVDSVIHGNVGNAGSGIGSGVSRDGGYDKVLTGANTVRVNGKPVARNGDWVLMNGASPDGPFNTIGELHTLEKGSAQSGAAESGAAQQEMQETPEESGLLYELGRSGQVLKGYAKGVAGVFTDAAEMAAEGWGHIVTNPLETVMAVGWGVKELGTMAVDGWNQIIQSPGEAWEAAKWGAGEIVEGAKEILGNGDLEEAGKRVGEAAILVAPVAMTKAEQIARAVRGARAAEVAAEARAAEQVAKVGRGEGVAKAESTGEGVRIEPRRTNHEGAAFGEKTAHGKMVEKGYEPVGNTDGAYHPGQQGIDGVYKNPSPPPDYIITDAKYNKADLGTLKDGTRQMSDPWIKERLADKVGNVEAAKIQQALDSGSVERWVIKVKPDGTSYVRKVDDGGYAIGHIPNF